MSQLTVWCMSKRELQFVLVPLDRYNVGYEVVRKNNRYAVFV